MRKLICLFFLCLSVAAFSQQFSKAPKLDRPVKQIIEWQTFPATDTEKEETRKGGVYTFRRDGNLTSFIGNDFEEKENIYHYDSQGRPTKVEMNSAEGNTVMSYTYDGDIKKAEIKGEGLYLVTTQFLNKNGKVSEEKTSGKAWFTDGKFQLVSRKVLNYNNLDSLFGEMDYTYRKAGKVEKKKTVHYFEAVKGKKSKTVYFDKKGKEEKVISYVYDDNGLLLSIETAWPGTNDSIKKEYRYKDGKLWIEVEYNDAEFERLEKIYKDGRMVRTKFFMDDELITYTDFQYTFF